MKNFKGSCSSNQIYFLLKYDIYDTKRLWNIKKYEKTHEYRELALDIPWTKVDSIPFDKESNSCTKSIDMARIGDMLFKHVQVNMSKGTPCLTQAKHPFICLMCQSFANNLPSSYLYMVALCRNPHHTNINFTFQAQMKEYYLLNYSPKKGI